MTDSTKNPVEALMQLRIEREEEYQKMLSEVINEFFNGLNDEITKSNTPLPIVEKEKVMELINENKNHVTWGLLIPKEFASLMSHGILSALFEQLTKFEVKREIERQEFAAKFTSALMGKKD